MHKILLAAAMMLLPASLPASEYGHPAHPASFMVGHLVELTWVRPDASLGRTTVRLLDVSPYGLVYKNGKHKGFRMWDHVVQLKCEVCSLPREWQQY